MRPLLAAALVLALAALVRAQAAVSEVSLVGPGGLCAAVRPGGLAAPPPDGTPLVLLPCDGSDAQRFSLCFGDCQDDVTFGYRSLVHASGRAVVRSGGPVPTAILRGGALRFWMATGGNDPTPSTTLTHCLTAAMPPVAGALLTVEPCDGRPGQAFAAR
jgi:hypothetical protein